MHARAVRANDIIIATKASFTATVSRLQSAIEEISAAGWLDGPERSVTIEIVQGPDRYLFGEETAMLEVIDGRLPLPRVAPPYRHGTVEVVTDPIAPAMGHDSFEGAADVVMAGEGGGREAPPTLAKNVETLANVPGIIGLLGTTMGKAGVNIANFSLGRNRPGGDAIALLYVDEPVTEDVLEELRASNLILQAKPLTFDV